MSENAKRNLKIAAGVAVAVLLIAITVNGAVDFWSPQVEVKTLAAPSAPPVEPAALQMPPVSQPLPAAPLTEREASTEPQWKQPLFEPKFDVPNYAPAGRPGGGAQGFAIPDFSSTLNQFAPPSQVLPPLVSTPGSDPAVVSIKPIFNSKSGGVDSGIGGAAGNVPGTVGNAVGGVTSGAGSLLKR